MTCTATVAGKHIPAAHKGAVANGIATCVWPLPKKDKGKTIRGTITLTVRARPAAQLLGQDHLAGALN